MQMKNILVLGGAGYIGSHCCKYLADQGYAPIVFDNLSQGHKDFVKWGPFIKGSLHETDKLIKVMKEYEPVAVMHLAAFLSVGDSVTNPSGYYNNNVVGTISLLDAMIKCDIKNIIFSSSCAIYGQPETIPIQEFHEKSPINPYGRTKLIIEHVLEDYETAYGLKSVCLRYFNAAGADYQSKIGEDHSPETHLIPLILDAALGRINCIEIFGDDYNTPDGTCIRDYLHIMDIAQAHFKSFEYLLAHGKSLRLNLGNEKGYSVKELIQVVKDITGNTFKVNISARRPGDPAKLIGSTQLAKTTLNWQPQYNAIDEIIRSAWEWHRKRFSV
ncbi:MAG: UDP-glucose 4-epimerase GalE [Fibrobacteria bacterium]|nr:UDP-glucose 4-epimerase GalE [Fibrobacteria bacterium]